MNINPDNQAENSANKSTVIWGRLEERRFLKLPKTFAYLGRYEPRIGKEIQPRHLVLIIALACRKYRDQPIRAYWEDLASALGQRADTVRRWAYQMRDLGLLEITPTPRPDGGNGPNLFDIDPFVTLVEEADAEWRRQMGEPDIVS